MSIVKQINPEWLYRQNCRLAKNKEAVTWLLDVKQISFNNVKHFGLGLTPLSNTRQFTDALCFPRLDSTGHFLPHYLYANIPMVTSWKEGVQPTDSWATYPVELYHSGNVAGKSTAVVVSDPMELWFAKTVLDADRDLSQRTHIIACTHGFGNLGSAVSAQDPQFWEKFKRIIICCGKGNSETRIIDGLLPFIGREVRIAPPLKHFISQQKPTVPESEHLTEDGTSFVFRKLLDAAQPYSCVFNVGGLRTEQVKEVDAQSLYHNGHLYYAFERLEQKENAEEFLPFVVKSDGSILKVVRSPRIRVKCVWELKRQGASSEEVAELLGL